jgi:hypothetical protein
MYLPDLPPRLAEPIACAISAVARYEIPANVARHPNVDNAESRRKAI